MSVTSANVRSLNESRVQALQALQSVSERLGDILGDTNLSGDGTRRNETGDLINEEGLPIIDITEPVDDLDTPSLSAATEDYDMIEEDSYPEPISKLSPEALAVNRKHRDKILDLLEQEEGREEHKSRRECQLEMRRKREAARIEMEKRMLNQGLELEKRRQAKELEKKMAKALISRLGDLEALNSKTPAPHPDGKVKKAVTFADPPAESKALPNPKQETEINWGDVVPATLPERKSRVANSRTQPMRMEVVEHTSPQTSDSASTLRPLEKLESTEPARDSDDESDLELSSDPSVLEFEDDIVLSAQHHRKLALEYHRRREALVSSAGALKLEDDELPGDHGHIATSWDREEVPLDATLVSPPPKPRISKFKASLFDGKNSQTPPITQPAELPSSPRESTGPSRSATFGTSVLPADSLSKSIKLGKLVGGQLVVPHDGEDIDRDEREEEEIRKLLLKSMEEYSGVAAQVMGPAAESSYWANSTANETGSSSQTPPPPASILRSKPKASRFKVNRTQSRTPSGPEATASPHKHESSASALPSNGFETTSTFSPSSRPMSNAEQPAPNLTPLHQSHTDTAKPPPYASFSSVIDSPSFAPLSDNHLPSSAPNRRLPSTPPTSISMVIDSPSFMPPSSNTIESSSFRQHGGPSSASAASTRGPPTIIPIPSRHPSERQAVMVENVKEKSVNRDSPVSSTTSDATPRRVSRFKSDRSRD